MSANRNPKDPVIQLFLMRCKLFLCVVMYVAWKSTRRLLNNSWLALIDCIAIGSVSALDKQSTVQKWQWGKSGLWGLRSHDAEQSGER